ncbi:hypothetical protein O0L34_g10349 [Tuta absoluta]|nr:hypothetical protein O0L34_g10349 [Tuta absoluta]
MAHCQKCKQFISTNKNDNLKCTKEGCETVWHKKCVQNLKKFERLGICENCQESGKQSPSPQEKIEINPKDTSGQSVLSELNKKLEIIHKMEKTLEDMKNDIAFYAAQYQEMVEFKKKTEKKLTSLEQKNVYLEKCNKALEERIQTLEQREKENNVEIFGMEKSDNEETINVVKKLAEKLSLNPEDISEAVRVGREKLEKDKPQPVIVTMQSRQARDKWIAKRKTTITNGQLYNNNSTKRIYINEDLPRYKRLLLWEAKNQLKPLFKYIWVQDYNILVKKDDIEKKIYKIRSQDDIKLLLSSSE